MSGPADAVSDHVRENHADLLRTVQACADAVADGWSDARAEEWTVRAATERSAVVRPLSARLRERDALAACATALEGGVCAAGYEPSAPPVAGPPYVVVTTRGPVLRATVEDGRFVVLLRAFRVERGPPPRYVRADAGPFECVETRFRQ